MEIHGKPACLHCRPHHTVPLGQYYVSQVNWNPDTEPWTAPGETGKLVREAMNRAINREQIINELFKGRGEPMYTTIFHDTLEGWNPRWKDEFDAKYGYDPELAKELLDQAGYPGDNGQNRFSLEVYQSSLPGLPETIEVAQTVAQSFEDIGIDVKLGGGGVRPRLGRIPRPARRPLHPAGAS